MADVIEAQDLTARHLGRMVQVELPDGGRVVSKLVGFTADRDVLLRFGNGEEARLAIDIQLEFTFGEIAVPGDWQIVFLDEEEARG